MTLLNALNVRAPPSVWEQCDTFRAITAGRKARSAALFVGGIAGSSRDRTRLPRSWCQPSSLSNRWLSRSLNARRVDHLGEHVQELLDHKDATSEQSWHTNRSYHWELPLARGPLIDYPC